MHFSKQVDQYLLGQYNQASSWKEIALFEAKVSNFSFVVLCPMGNSQIQIGASFVFGVAFKDVV